MTERHPLLERASVDNLELQLEFQEHMVGMVPAPDLTYQYSDDGELSTSSLSTYTWLCEDAPALYHERFVRRWTIPAMDRPAGSLNGETCWLRLQELIGDVLRRLPDNPFVLEDAWLAGLTQEVPVRFRSMLAHLHARIAEYRAQQAQDSETVSQAHETGQRQVLRSWMTGSCCNGHSDQCSFDHATEYALPDGSRQIEYRCCY